jgi:RNA recognition motif-containing protein
MGRRAAKTQRSGSKREEEVTEQENSGSAPAEESKKARDAGEESETSRGFRKRKEYEQEQKRLKLGRKERNTKGGKGDGEGKKEEHEAEGSPGEVPGESGVEKSEQRGKSKGGKEDERTVFVTNLSYKEKEEDLAKKMEKYGSVEKCTLLVNRETGESTGRAFVLFKDKASCKAAMKDEIILHNRILTTLKYVFPETLKEREKEKKAKDDRRKQKIAGKRKKGIKPEEASEEEKRSTCRVYVSHISKKLDRKGVAKIVSGYFARNGRIAKIRGINLASDEKKRNPGYCFITFKLEEDALFFVNTYREIEAAFGKGSYTEFAMETKAFQDKGFAIRKNTSHKYKKTQKE